MYVQTAGKNDLINKPLKESSLFSFAVIFGGHLLVTS